MKEKRTARERIQMFLKISETRQRAEEWLHSIQKEKLLRDFGESWEVMYYCLQNGLGVENQPETTDDILQQLVVLPLLESISKIHGPYLSLAEIPVGVLQSADCSPNAHTIKPLDHDGGPVIIVDSQLFCFALDIVPLVVHLFVTPKDHRRDIRNSIDKLIRSVTSTGDIPRLVSPKYNKAADVPCKPSHRWGQDVQE